MSSTNPQDRAEPAEIQREYLVERTGNRVHFRANLNAQAHGQFLWCLHECLRLGYEDVVLDLSECERAYQNGVLPLIASVDELRRAGNDASAILPTDNYLQRLFLNANWAHLLEPDRYGESNTYHPVHVPARRFSGPEEQQRLVNETLDVLLRSIPSFQRDDLNALEWSINEITDNVLNHADCDLGGILQVNTFERDRKVAVGVVDSGRGILASLREGHPSLKDDVAAIYKALEAGVTRGSDEGQGNGLAGALRIATRSGGQLEVTSGGAQVRYSLDGPTPYERPRHLSFRGTFVYLEIDLDSELEISDALAMGGRPHRPIDIIETLYETEDGNAIALQLRSEKVGFGSRLAGRQIRTKCLNLLDAAPTKPLLLDWDGVPLISSSFADELVGKLFAALGPLAFSTRIRNVGMRRVVYDLIDKAIMQRAGQTLGGTGSDSPAPTYSPNDESS